MYIWKVGNNMNISIKDYLQKRILLFDGAMGTYFAHLDMEYSDICEKANIDKPEVIYKIHSEYLQAGASLVRTNTFAANKYDLNCTEAQRNNIIKAGYEIASRAISDTEGFVGCSIGPIAEREKVSQEEIILEYKNMADTFIELGASVFVLETFASPEEIKELTQHITLKNPKAEIITLFSVNMHGYSKKGINYRKIIENAKNLDGVIATGFNCGAGAGHLLKLIKSMDFDLENFAAIPNAGYPEKIMDRTIYQSNADYFAETEVEICRYGIKIVGGCCGTTPEHISKINKALAKTNFEIKTKPREKYSKKILMQYRENSFRDKLERGEFVNAVEIDPPFGYDVSKLMEAAHILKQKNADIITIADSPLGKMRLDSLIMSAKIYREVGIDVMPHVCCRDKNIIALKALISASFVENIRNFLFVTGDPLPEDAKGEVKSVFNMNSVKLMTLVKEMNEEFSKEDGFYYGGALNPQGANIERIIEKVLLKKQAGASYLLTQPIFTQKDIENIILIKKRTGIKILGGILPLVSYKNARFIDNEFAGMNIPENIINSFDTNMSREEAQEQGINIAVEVGRKLKEHVDGFYFMTPFNRAEMVGEIMERLN